MKRHALWLPVLALTATILVLAYAARKPEPSQATLENVRAEARNGGYRLITTEELWGWYQSKANDLLLVDTRQEWEYRTGHIMGAVNFPMEPTWLSRWRKKSALAQLIGADKNRTIVFYWAGLAWVRSDSAARVAVQLGCQKVYRDPLGYPPWLDRGLPVEKATNVIHPVQPPINAKRRPLQGWGLLWTLLGVFAGGMALNLTPCVYPIIPVTISYFAGQSDRRQSRLVAHGACYVIGLAVTNSLLGVTAALTGGLMGALLQNPVVLIAIATVLVLFAASLFGFWEMRLPFAMTQIASRGYAGYVGSLFMGLTMGVVAAPCIGPFVLGLLTWVAGLGSAWLGFVVFFTLSLGLGLPLFVLALFSGQLKRLPRSGEWMLWVRKMMGWVLVGMAAYYLRALLPTTVYTFLLSSVALAAGLHLGWMFKVQAQSSGFKWIRAFIGTAGLVLATLLIGGWVLRGPGITWQPYSDDVLKTAHRVGKPVIVDFYADWCSPCVKLESETFHQSDIVSQARKDFIMVKVDLTRADNALNEVLLKRYNVKGVPTIVFIGPDGRERHDLRLVDFLPADQFLERMTSLTKENSGG